MKHFWVLMVLMFFVSSCSPQANLRDKDKNIINDDGEFKVDTVIITKEAQPQKAATLEPTFVYTPPVLNCDAPPKLTGIITGHPPLAVIEILDQGHILGIGEKKCGYLVQNIESNVVILKKGRQTIKLEIN